MYHILYKITNLLNNKIYIGQHSTNNLDDGYMGSSKILNKDIKLYGLSNFKKEIIAYCNTKEELIDLESEYVDKTFVERSDTYNVNLGGNSFYYINNHVNWNGFDFINKNKLNNSAGQCYIAANKIKSDEEYRKQFGKKISNSLKERFKNKPRIGHKHTEESKRKIGIINSIKQSGSGNSNYGKCWICNDQLKDCKSVLRSELEHYISIGYRKGRNMSYTNRHDI